MIKIAKQFSLGLVGVSLITFIAVLATGLTPSTFAQQVASTSTPEAIDDTLVTDDGWQLHLTAAQVDNPVDHYHRWGHLLVQRKS